MKKHIFTISVFLSIIYNLSAQESYSITHIYGLNSDFYYLNIFQNETYILKIGMYGNQEVHGKYEIDGDTLKFITINFKENKYGISKYEKFTVERALSTFLIQDTLLIPLKFRESDPRPRITMRDSTIAKAYTQGDGHVQFIFSFYSDSTFIYETGSDMDRSSTKGIWQEYNNTIYLESNDSNNYLHWICTNNKLSIFENYLICVTFDEETKKTEYQYLRRIKPKD